MYIGRGANIQCSSKRVVAPQSIASAAVVDERWGVLFRPDGLVVARTVSLTYGLRSVVSRFDVRFLVVHHFSLQGTRAALPVAVKVAGGIDGGEARDGAPILHEEFCYMQVIFEVSGNHEMIVASTSTCARLYHDHVGHTDVVPLFFPSPIRIVTI